MNSQKKKILLFSTLNPYPFWAGSENLWYDLVADERTSKDFEFELVLADSPVTRKKADELKKFGAKSSFYKHFNVHFTKRNWYRVWDKLFRRPYRLLPWYDKIQNSECDMVWFNVSALGDLKELQYPIELCRKKGIPYWLLLQHGYEDFFITSDKDMQCVTEVVKAAKRFVFISKKNRNSLERAMGERIENAFHSVNAIPAAKIELGKELNQKSPVQANGTTKFFNLGRFSPQDKAQHLLLEALAGEQWKERDWQLSFIGVSGFGQSYLEKLVGFYGLDKDRIKIVQHTDNVFSEIVKNDVLLMPSLSEGMPFAMIESMACGRPAMGTPVAGIPELIEEGQTGWLTRTIDVCDISETLEKVWRDRDKWLEMGRKAQQHVEKNFNEQNTFAVLLDLLKEDARHA